MSDTPEIAGAKRKLELQATELPNWARQLLDYIAQTERENAALRGLLIEVRDASRAWGFPTVADTIDRRLAALGQQPHTEDCGSPVKRSGGFCSCYARCGDAPGWEDALCAEPHGFLLKAKTPPTKDCSE